MNKIECRPCDVAGNYWAEQRANLDFRPVLLKSHYQTLIEQGYPIYQAKEIVQGIAQRELTYLFLERYLQAQLVHFSYRFEGQNLVSSGYETLGDVCQRYQAAIDERRRAGRPSTREEAELAGIGAIKDQLSDCQLPVSLMIVSPPPPASERHLYPGYADYSFYFFGHFDPQGRTIDMFAWRNEKTLKMQRQEVNSLAGGDFIAFEAHPNDFLRMPIFAESGELGPLREIIDDMPTEDDFERAKNADWAKYSVAISDQAQMLSTLIENGASERTLLDAQVKIEMDFVRWASDGTVTAKDFDPTLLLPEHHGKFGERVREEFGWFVTQYNTSRFACGSCGGSALGLYNSSYSPRLPGLLELSLIESMSSYIPCPGCGKSLRAGSEKCGQCGLTKVEFDFKKAA